ncbi:MAG TPA: cyclic nucleotide-binding domain-containing protein [Kofleriaceae bacterium]|nr:cyclic nucleotide-binding domain-containing protein [Kofleriaceae bacterium]
MHDFNPKGLRRMLSLRQFPLFDTADLDEVATVAENLVETSIPAGTIVASRGVRMHGVHLILDGHIETRPRGQHWGPRSVFGALEVFADREAAHTAVAATDLRTLHLSGSEVGELLEDNFGVLLAAVRELASRLLVAAPLTSRPTQPVPCSGPLDLVERLIVLRQQLPFASARLQALATLAHASDEVLWPAHSTIVRTGDAATSAFVIVDGAAVARRGDTVHTLGPGSPIGHLETLAGVQHGMTVETTLPVRALRSSGTAILDVLEDHTDVALAMMATFSGALLDATARFN